MVKYFTDHSRVLLSAFTFLLALSVLPAQNELRLYSDSIQAECGDTVTLSVRVSDFVSVVALDFSLTWNAASLERIGGYTNLNTTLGLSAVNFGPYPSPDNDTLNFQWSNFQSDTLADNDILFSIPFIVRGGGGLSATLVFGDTPTPIVCGKKINNIIQEVDVITATGHVLITDTEDPVLSCPKDTIVIVSNGTTMWTANGLSPVSSDNCAIDSVTYSLTGATSGSGLFSVDGVSFNSGTTVVSYRAVDFAGNHTDCSFSVTVRDTILRFFLDSGQASCDDTLFTLDVTTRNFLAITSAQFGIFWDKAILEYKGIINLNSTLGLSPSNFGPGTIDDTLTMSWANGLGETLPDDAVLFSISFSVQGNPGAQTLAVFGSTPSIPIEASKFQTSGPPVQVGVETFDATIDITDEDDPDLGCPPNRTVTIPQGQSAWTATGISPSLSDNCGVPDLEFLVAGATSASGNGSVDGTSLNLGTNTITYQATDQAGNDSICTFQVTVLKDSLILIIDPITADCSEDSITVCVTSRGFNNLGSLQFAISWDSQVLGYTGIGQTNPILALNQNNFGPVGGIVDTLTFNWFNGLGDTIPNDSILFCINFEILGGPNSSTALNFISTPVLPIEAAVIEPPLNNLVVIPVFLSDGSFSTSDNEPPVLGPCPSPIVVYTSAITCDATATWTEPTASDNCTADPAVVCDNLSGSTFPVGTTPVTCIATDDAGQSDTCSFTVTVLDTFSPAIICDLTDLIVSVTDTSCTASVSWNLPLSLDNCSPVSVSGPPAGGTFTTGNYTIEYIFTDPSGNSSICGFNLFVLDNTPPVVTSCPGDVTVMATSANCTAFFIPPTPNFADNCDSIADIQFRFDGQFYDPGTQIEVPKGSSTITWYAFDLYANLDSCVYTVTVEGGGNYQLACPSDVNVVLSGTDCDTLISWPTPGISGGCGLNPGLHLVASTVPGSAFSPGITIVNYVLIDTIVGDTLASCAFSITVSETRAPAFTNCPGTLSLISDGITCKATANWTAPTATDDCGGSVTVVQTAGPTPGDLSNGIYTVTYVATDGSGNTSICNILVSVCDTLAPLVQGCPSDIEVSLPAVTDSCNTNVNWIAPSFEDECDGSNLTLTNSHQPGVFSTGTTTVTYTATDNCGNTSTCSFNVRVIDFIPPVANCQADVTITSNGTVVSDANGFIDSLVVTNCKEVRVYFRQPGGTDNCSSVSTIQIDVTGLSSGDVFPDGGVYELAFAILDASGNRDTCRTKLTVLPYSLNVSADPIPVCEDDDVNLSVESIAGATYSWSGPGGFSSNLQNPILPMVTQSDAGTYSVTVSIAGCPKTLTGSVTVDLLEAPGLNADTFTMSVNSTLSDADILINDVINANANYNITFLQPLPPGNLVNNLDGTFEYTPPQNFSGVIQFSYEVCYQECPGLCATTSVTIEVGEPGCEPNNLITPNNDNRNDVVVFKCLDKFPRNSFYVYNQWGDQVYSASPYNNDWNGTLQGEAGKPLPDGTYYYLFYRGNNSEPEKGFITILR